MHSSIHCRIIYNSQETTCVSINRWMEKDVVYMYQGILLSHKSEILPFVTTWMDLEGIMLGELNLTEKNKYSMTWLVCQL